METFEKWFPFSVYDETDSDTVLVFCFHHAGGTASAYKSWTNSNDKKVAFIPIELPGKGCRMGEDYIYDMRILAERAAEAITEFAGSRRFLLYGHSMGAAIAFKTAYEIEHTYPNKAAALIVSGRHAPCISLQDRYTTNMEDDELVKELTLIGGTPKEILENRELLNIFIPYIKNDYKLNESFIYNDEVISVPIYAYAGTDDIDADITMLDAWSTVTTGELVKREFSGGHFFIFDLGAQYISELRRRIGNFAEVTC